LNQLGRSSEEDYENFRIVQLVISLPVVLTLIFASIFGVISLPATLILSIITVGLTFILSERNLSARCARRNANVESEFPAIVEMLTLSVGAGESPPTAMKRISRRAHGHLAEEFKIVVSEVEKGVPFATALDRMGKRINSDSIRRFVDMLIISISRGTPLVETLTHNANESRIQERVRVLTAAGKSEISMMIPVVFLILPVSILFALFPSLNSLNLFSG
jgi:tight adherence protein C